MTRESSMETGEVGLNLALLWALIRKHLRQIVGYSFSLGVVVTLLSLFVIPKKYEAQAVLLPPTEDFTGGASWIKSLVPGLGGGTSAEIVIAMLQSDRVCWSVIQNLRLDTLWEDTSRQDLIKRAQDRLKVESDVTLGTIQVKFRERDPRLAARIVREFLYVTEQLNDTLKISPVKPFLKVLDPPYPPKKKASPKTSLNVLLTLFLATFLLSGYFGYREVRKPHIDDCWDLKLVIGDLPCRLWTKGLGSLKYPGLRVVSSENPGILTWFPGVPKGLLDQLVQDLQALSLTEGGESRWILEGPVPEHLPRLARHLRADQELWVLLPKGKVSKTEVKEFWDTLRQRGLEPTLFVVVAA